MKKMKALLSIFAACVMTVSLCTGCSGTPASPENAQTPPENAQTPSADTGTPAEENWPEISLVLGHCMTDDSIINDDALYLKKEIEAATKGTVTVEIYSGSVLGTEVQMMEGMQSGTVDMMITPPSIIMSFISDFGVFDIPYLVQGFDHARTIWHSEVGDALEEKLEAIGITCFGVADFGYRNATNNIRPIVTPADVKGLKMRTMTSEVSLALWGELGAEAVAMAINEVFSALQTGVIDGQENPYTAIQTNGFYEVQKYCSATQHQYNMLNFLVATSALDRMADGQREAFISAFENAEAVSKEYMDKRTADSIAFMESKGMKFNECDLAAFQEAAQPVIEKFADQYGRDVIEKIQSLANQ